MKDFYQKTFEQKVDQIQHRIMELDVEENLAWREAEFLIRTNGDKYRDVHDIAGTFLKFDTASSEKETLQEAKRTQLNTLYFDESEMKELLEEFLEE
ncbi:MAG: hypothetical protein BRC39_06220 [Cyanobacteria bacterium QH_7_48_89]|nr:MAG: hypothetical protein BRC39_06220 [Cyanobacteria bacterium QH_7_48_89]